MAVEIKFTGDFSDVQRQLDRMIADARAHPIQLGGTFSAGAASVGGGSPTPTTVGVLGAANVASGFGNVPSYLGSNFLQSAGGFGAQSANPGFFSAGMGAGGGVAAGIFGFSGSGSSATGGAGPIGSGGTAGPSGAIQQVIASRITNGNIIAPPVFSGGGMPTVSALEGGGGFGGAATAGSGGSSGYGGYGGNLFSSSRFLGLSTSGLSRYVAGGFIAREALRGFQASRDYSVATILAGSNQREQLKAEQQFQSTVGSFPIVGQAADLFSDSLGASRAGTEAIMRSTDAQEQRTVLRREFGDESARRTFSATIAGIPGTFSRAEAEATEKNRLERQAITRSGYGLGESDRNRINAEEARLNESREERATNQALGMKGLGWGEAKDIARTALEISDRATIAGMRTEANKKISDLLAPENASADLQLKNSITEISRQRSAAAAIFSIGQTGDVAVAAAIGQGRDSDSIARIKLQADINTERRRLEVDKDITSVQIGQFDVTSAARKAALEKSITDRIYGEQNKYRDSVSVARDQATAAKARYDAQPLDAMLASHRARTTAALADIDPIADPELWDATEERMRQEKRGIIKDYRFERGQRLAESEARGRVLDVELKGGIYSGVAANAVEIKEQAFLKLAEQQEHGERSKTMIQDLRNAQAQEQLLSRNFLLNFKPTEIDLQKTNLSGSSGSGNEVLATLKASYEAQLAIKNAVENLGKAQ